MSLTSWEGPRRRFSRWSLLSSLDVPSIWLSCLWKLIWLYGSLSQTSKRRFTVSCSRIKLCKSWLKTVPFRMLSLFWVTSRNSASTLSYWLQPPSRKRDKLVFWLCLKKTKNFKMKSIGSSKNKSSSLWLRLAEPCKMQGSYLRNSCKLSKPSRTPQSSWVMVNSWSNSIKRKRRRSMTLTRSRKSCRRWMKRRKSRWRRKRESKSLRKWSRSKYRKKMCKRCKVRLAWTAS